MSAGARASADAPSPKRVAALVLAAGRSSRLGTPKQLLEIEGKPLLRRTVETALASQVALVVVAVEMGAVAIADSLRGQEWQRAEVADPGLGQSESIRAALGVLERHELDAVVITPCDLPLLSSAHLNALIARYSEGDCLIVASRYQGTAGAPMLIDRAL